MTTQHTLNIRKRSWLVSGFLIAVLGNALYAQDNEADTSWADSAAHAEAGLKALDAGNYEQAVKELTIAATASGGLARKRIRPKQTNDLGRA